MIVAWVTALSPLAVQPKGSVTGQAASRVWGAQSGLAVGSEVRAEVIDGQLEVFTFDAPSVFHAGDLEIVDGAPTRDGMISSVYWSAWLLDAATVEGVGAVGVVPTGWATIAIDIWWSNAGAGSGNVRWEAFFDDKADGATLATHATDHDAAIAAPAQNVLKKSTVVTTHAVTPGELYNVVVRRDAADAADTLANDCALLAVVVRRTS
jgi:hypothetical protein